MMLIGLDVTLFVLIGYLVMISTRWSQIEAVWNICGVVSRNVSNKKHESELHDMSEC